MRKELVTFRCDGELEQATLELSAVCLPVEHKQVLAEMLEYQVCFTFIDADSIMGKIVDEYDHVFEILEKLIMGSFWSIYNWVIWHCGELLILIAGGGVMAILWSAWFRNRK